MRSLIFLISFLATPVVNAQFLGADQKILLDLQCSKLKLLNCDLNQLPETLKTSLAICNTVIETPSCKKLIAEDPTLSNKLKKCDPETFCTETLSRSYYSLRGCSRMYAEVLTDQITFVSDFIESSYENIKNNIKKKNQFIESCNTSISCKRLLIGDHPSYIKLSDLELSKYSASFLWTEGENRKYALSTYYRIHSQNKDSQNRNQNLSLNSKTTPDKTDFHLKGLALSASDWLNQQGIKFTCFNNETQAEMLCYAAAQIIDPIAAVGILSKFPHLQKIFKQKPKERRIGSNVPIDNSLKREAIKSQLLHAQYTTEAQNISWIEKAEKLKSKYRKFIEIENSKLKYLNDTIKDKDLVTAMTNMHKQMTMTQFQHLQKKFPDLKFYPYSDFKSMRFAVEGKITPTFEKELNDTYRQIQEDFTRWVNQNKLVRTSDDPPETWFKMGMGDHADEASTAARYMRSSNENYSGANFNQPHLKQQVRMDLIRADKLRADLVVKLKGTGLTEKTEHGVEVFKVDVFEAIRKAESPKDLKNKIINRFGLESIDESTIRQLQEYSHSVDNFSPSLHIAKREIASLDVAEFGGFSVDFVGLGAHNLHGTAAAIAGRSDVGSSLMATRKSEKQVTEVFNKRKSEVKEISQGVVGEKLQTICSGDDCVGIPKAPLTDSDKKQLLKAFASSSDGSNVRVAFIQPKISDIEARTTLATHGESIEKHLRASLEGQIEPNRLKGLLFGIDMKTTRIAEGPVALITASSPNIKLSESEIYLINSEFKKALQRFNSKLGDKKGYSPN